MPFVEENEISEKSNGGTELTKRLVGKMIDEELASEFQIVPSRVRDIQEDKIRIYWAHDLPEDPECSWLKSEHMRNRFHKIVFVSNWQMNEFVNKLNIPYSNKFHVIENPIEPLQLQEKSKEEIRLIYFSTPQRGLGILVPVVEKLVEKYPNLHLDVFSSFAIYGWPDADKQFEPLYDEIRNHPNMTYHGFTDQETLRSHLEKAHILAYPCIWKETSCRVLIESMSAGLLCVHPNLGALSDTSGGLTSMYQFDQDVNMHANMFYTYLDQAIARVNEENVQKYLKFVKAYADTRFNLQNISFQWKTLLTDLKGQYPDVESRKLAKYEEVFSYKTS